jgi:hypothetical protein
MRWFAQDVLWLNPEPTQQFRDHTAAVWDAFPHHAPFGGVQDDVVPHMKRDPLIPNRASNATSSRQIRLPPRALSAANPQSLL